MMAVSEFNVGVQTFVTAATITIRFDCGVSAEKLTKAKDDERVAMMVRKGNAIQKSEGKHIDETRHSDMTCWSGPKIGHSTAEESFDNVGDNVY